MTVLRHEIRIDAPVDKVWAVLADLEAVGAYNPLVASVKLVGESRSGVNAVRLCQFKPKGFSEERVTDWKPGELLGIEVVRISFPMAYCRWKTRLAADGDGTRVSQELEYAVKFGLLGALMNGLLMKRKYDAVLASIFRGLKHHVEKGGSGAVQ